MLFCSLAPISLLLQTIERPNLYPNSLYHISLLAISLLPNTQYNFLFSISLFPMQEKSSTSPLSSISLKQNWDLEKRFQRQWMWFSEGFWILMMVRQTHKWGRDIGEIWCTYVLTKSRPLIRFNRCYYSLKRQKNLWVKR